MYRYIVFCLAAQQLFYLTLFAEALTLKDCQKIALSQNPIKQAACHGVKIAKESVGVFEAPYYPQVDLNAHYQRWQRHNFLTLNDPLGTIPPGILPNIIGPTNDYDLSFHSRYLLFDWGKRRADLMASLARQAAACLEVNRVEQEILLNVSVAFYTLFANFGLKDVAIKNLERAKKNHELTLERQSVGAVPLSDVYRAQVEVAQGTQMLVRAESILRISHANLNAAMGLPPESDFEVESVPDFAFAFDQKDLQQAQKCSLYQRPEIKILQKEICALKQRVKADESEFGPQVTAIGGYGKRDSNWTPSDDEWLFGVSLQLPIFSGFETTHKVRRSKAHVCQVRAEYDRLCLDIQKEVSVAYSKLLEAYEMVQTSTAQVKDAQESARLTEERYRAGSGIISDLLDAQTALARAEATHVDAVWSYESAKAVFLWTQGALIPN